MSEEFQPYLDKLRTMMEFNARGGVFSIGESERVAIAALMMRVVEQDKSLALMRQYNLEYQKIAQGAQQLYEEIGQLKNDLKRERDGRADVANLLANYKLIAQTNDIERDDLQRKHDSIYAGAHNDILNLLAVLKHGWTAGDDAVVEDIRRRWIAELGDVRPAESTGYPDYGAIDPRAENNQARIDIENLRADLRAEHPGTATRNHVYKAIDSERDFQDRKWGTIEQHPHELGGWLTIMRQLLRDAEKAWASSASDYTATNEIRKVIAVGVACCEQCGVQTRSKFIEATGGRS